MTPLARLILSANPFDKSLDGAHFYDTSAIIEVICDAHNMLFGPGTDLSDESFSLRLPFNKVCVEERAPGADPVLFIYESAADVITVKHKWRDGEMEVLKIDQKDFRKFEYAECFNQLEFDGWKENVRAASPREYAFRLLHVHVARLLIINTPQSFVQRWRPAKIFGRSNKAFAGGRFPLMGWTEIKLEVNPATLRECGAPERRITGRKAFHWVRGHFRRYLSGLILWIDAHTRGDASIGIRQTRYSMRIRDDERRNGERRETVRRAVKRQVKLHRSAETIHSGSAENGK